MLIIWLFKYLVAGLFYPPIPEDLMQKMLFFFWLTDSVLGLCLPPTAASHRHGPWRQCSQVHTVGRRSRLHLHHWSTDWRHSRTGGAGQVGDHCHSQNTWRNEYEGCVENVRDYVTSLMHNVTVFEKWLKIHPVITILETYFHTNEWRCRLCCITVSVSEMLTGSGIELG